MRFRTCQQKYCVFAKKIVECLYEREFIMNYFSSNLKFLREKFKLSRLDLSKKLNVNQSTISRWENGEMGANVDNAYDVSMFFNVSISDLIGKDLRLIEKNIDLPKLSEDEVLRLFKQEFTKKGFLDENEEMTKETFDNLIEFAKINKKFIMKSEEKK